MRRKQTYFTPQDINDQTSKIWQVYKEFNTTIDTLEYPCLGAKAAMNTAQYRFGLYDEMSTPETTSLLADDLKRYIDDTVSSNSRYMSMIAVFNDEVSSEIDFETRLWKQLQDLSDHEQGASWDSSVSADPENPNFSFSFNGTAFFIVGLHPHSSRKARRFPYTAMAFNLHRQFEQLRDAGVYEKMKQVIREREINYDGKINPMLRDHGQGLEAPQYSGREVDSSWKCPFHKP